MDRNKWLLGGGAGVIAIALLWFMLPGKGGEAPASQTEQTAPGNAAGTSDIPLTGDQAKAMGLRFAAALATSEMPVATLPAMVMPPPNSRVAVAAQLPGIVTRVHVVDGAMVTAGQTLATISSRDMVSLGADLSRARARLSVARANAARMNQLSREGIIAGARAEEASAALRQAEVDVAEQARLIGMTNGSASGGGYSLTAPISGRISAMAIETGKAVDPAVAPFVIDGSGGLQAEAQLPERLIGTMQPGMRVGIGAGQTGTVIAVGTAIDPATRSARLTASLPAGAPVRAGQSINLSIMGAAPSGAIRVPADAIAQIAGGPCVFVRTPRGVAVRKVTLPDGGAGSGDDRVVLSGLRAGEQVAVTGVSELKSLAAAR